MTRLRVDSLTVARKFDRLTVARIANRLTVTGSMNRFAVTGLTDCISVAKGTLALLVSFSLLSTPVWAAPASSLGTVVYADRAHVGTEGRSRSGPNRRAQERKGHEQGKGAFRNGNAVGETGDCKAVDAAGDRKTVGYSGDCKTVEFSGDRKTVDAQSRH